jgi:hypothetical protein
MQPILRRQQRKQMAELAPSRPKQAAIARNPHQHLGDHSVTISASDSRRRAFAGRSGKKSSAVQ